MGRVWRPVPAGEGLQGADPVGGEAVLAVSGALGHHPVTDVYSVDDGGLGDVGDGAVVVSTLREN